MASQKFTFKWQDKSVHINCNCTFKWPWKDKSVHLNCNCIFRWQDKSLRFNGKTKVYD